VERKESSVIANLLAKMLAWPAVTDWLIRRAMGRPYTSIVKDGKLYMERFWLFNPYPADSSGKGNWLPSARLHRIVLPDQDRHLHDHPWNARTFILRGWYWEERIGENQVLDPATGGHSQSYCRIVRPEGTTTPLCFGEYHRITELSDGGVWTLFITWRYRGTWGFLVDGEKVAWRTYLGLDK
jgi:hypothetical protein